MPKSFRARAAAGFRPHRKLLEGGLGGAGRQRGARRGAGSAAEDRRARAGARPQDLRAGDRGKGSVGLGVRERVAANSTRLGDQAVSRLVLDAPGTAAVRAYRAYVVMYRNNDTPGAANGECSRSGLARPTAELRQRRATPPGRPLGRVRRDPRTQVRNLRRGPSRSARRAPRKCGPCLRSERQC